MNAGRQPAPDGSEAFDLRDVSWGYQQIFAEAIDELRREGAIGPQREKATRVFFDMLRRATAGTFDHALKEFLGALNRRTKWILELPGIFEDFCRLGRELSAEKLSRGITFFRLWGEGAFGDSPVQLRALLNHVRTLRTVDAELAQAFLLGYKRLLEHLTAAQIDRFVEQLLAMHHDRPATAVEFAALRLKSAEVYVQHLACGARLEAMRDRLVRLMRAVAGRTLAVGDWSNLDSDYLIERGSKAVCFSDALYVPAAMRLTDHRATNEALYKLEAVFAAAAVRLESFPALHGADGCESIAAYCGGDRRLAAALTLIELARVVRHLRRRMPGLRGLLDFALKLEFDATPPRTKTDRLLRQCLTEGTPRRAFARRICAAADASESCEQSLALARKLTDEAAGAIDADVRAMLLFPDFGFPTERAQVPPQAPDMRRLRRKRREDEDAERQARQEENHEKQDEAEESEAGQAAAFFYPEWNHLQNDYYENWCMLRQRAGRPQSAAALELDERDERAIARARRMFERLRPDLARKEKFLPDGDEINVDRLVEYLATRRRLPAPKVQFYEKTFIRRRDLAVALLLDVSGSTAGAADGSDDKPAAAGQKRIIDVQKHAAMILGEGLEVLGDAFGLYGFSGSGRTNCEFYVYKELDEPFGPRQRARLLAAHPSTSTRMGVAIRHCAEKLAAHPARKKILLLITDGRPQDSGYDPATRYAQYDVRMACQECARREIHVVGVTTVQNDRADLEIMFPHRRFVVLPDMTALADVLPKLYLKMTA